jgi:hypothetical protein
MASIIVPEITFQQFLGENIAGRHPVINSGFGESSQIVKLAEPLRRCRGAGYRTTHKEVSDNKSDNIGRRPELSTLFRLLANPP